MTSHGEWSIQEFQRLPTLSTKIISITLSPRTASRHSSRSFFLIGDAAARARDRVLAAFVDGGRHRRPGWFDE